MTGGKGNSIAFTLEGSVAAPVATEPTFCSANQSSEVASLTSNNNATNSVVVRTFVFECFYVIFLSNSHHDYL